MLTKKKKIKHVEKSLDENLKQKKKGKINKGI